eukprot:TRINITY_DN3160_c2_g4_i1.p1 TRINITY_DN3160_c2_g4~~TRINITY_DN3160_c2_g4_i1.p1  ORF type:complete len:412 (-),score=49.93 TRINITY_DN3160_c2_g4_i1:452-1687(-)
MNRRTGDWNCIQCKHINFSSRNQCQRCGTTKLDSSTRPNIRHKQSDWNCDQCNDLNFASRNQCRKCGANKPYGNKSVYTTSFSISNIQIKPGDWNCGQCNELNFSSRDQCRKCGAGKYANATSSYNRRNNRQSSRSNNINISTSSIQSKPGDWNCSQCKDLNFASRTQCHKCGASKTTLSNSTTSSKTKYSITANISTSFAASSIQAKPGDWNCDQCNDLNFASRNQCRKCGANKPYGNTSEYTTSFTTSSIQAKPGDWNCDQCNDLNFASRNQCRICGAKKPSGSSYSKQGSNNNFGYPVQTSTPVSNDPVIQQKHSNYTIGANNIPTFHIGNTENTVGNTHSEPVGHVITSAEEIDKPECVICLVEDPVAVITVCGHMCCCMSCIDTVTNCPMCRKEFSPEQVVRVYTV